jgi:hypothetical protein
MSTIVDRTCCFFFFIILVIIATLHGCCIAKGRVWLHKKMSYWRCGRDSDSLRAGRSGDRINFCAVQNSSEAHPEFCAMDTGPFLGLKRPEHFADHSLPSSTRFRMGWRYTSAPSPSHRHVMEWRLPTGHIWQCIVWDTNSLGNKTACTWYLKCNSEKHHRCK